MKSKIMGLVAVGLLTGPFQVAQSTVFAQASAKIYDVGVEFYQINPNGPASSWSFVDTNNELRALVSADVGPPCIFDDSPQCQATQAVQFSNRPTLPVASISANSGAGSAFGTVTTTNNGEDPVIEAGCQVTALNSGCGGVAVFSTTAPDPYFFNLTLGANTGVRLTALTDVSWSLLNFCNITCDRVFAQAQLMADFTNSGAGRQRASNDFFVDASFLSSPHNGALFQDYRNNFRLNVDYQNLTGGSITGRLRFLAQAYAASVPEPGTFALLGLGLAGLGLSRRRKA